MIKCDKKKLHSCFSRKLTWPAVNNVVNYQAHIWFFKWLTQWTLKCVNKKSHAQNAWLIATYANLIHWSVECMNIWKLSVG